MSANSVFVSHSSKDDALVRKLRQALEERGIEVWADSERMSAGDPLSAAVLRNIEDSGHFIVVVSLNALNSSWVRREVQHRRSLPNSRIIGLLLPGIEPAALEFLCGEDLLGIKLDGSPAAIQNALHEILAALGLQLPTETIPAPLPPSLPVSDLLLVLSDPTVEQLDGKYRAAATARLIYTPAAGTAKGESQRYRFTAPLGPIEAEELSWYLERYVNWPAGLFEERAQRVVKTLPEWGRLLYDAVNAEPAHDVLQQWINAGGAERRFTVKVEKALVAGTPAEKQREANEAATLLLSLPWELIHDKSGYLFQGKNAVRVRRSLPREQAANPLVTDPPIRVLLVSPRPEDESAQYIDHRASARPLVEALTELGDLAELKLLEPPTFAALENELLAAAGRNQPYHVIHFDGHGVYDRYSGLGKLCFEHPEDSGKLHHRRSVLIDADEIGRIVRDHRIPLFFLEACQTSQAVTDPSASVAGRLLESGVGSVAAMSHSVLVETALRFVRPFYQTLLSGKRIGQAMLAGQRELKSTSFRGKSFSGELHLEDWFVPVLFQEETDPPLVHQRPVKPQQQELALGNLPPAPKHEFLGRGRDLLAAERLLVKERHLVVRGSGGEGKTTFAAELARWLVATKRFDRATFTSVENLTEARQVLHSIGGQLVPNFEAQTGTDDKLALQLVERGLKERPTVLVIDNIESILDNPTEILELCAQIGKTGETRLLFTTRESLPAPWNRNELEISRLDRNSAIRLLHNVLDKDPDGSAKEEDLEALVDAVQCHARSLVLISNEVGASGVRAATANLRPVLAALEKKNPDSRENSLLASAELSLRRLPEDIRERIRPLSVFHGGGGVPAIGMALQLEEGQFVAVIRALIGVGLAEYVEPQYLRFDPALMGGGLTSEEREAAEAAWAEAMEAELNYLYNQQFEDISLSNHLTLLDLPNLLAVLERLADRESPERAVGFATLLEGLLSTLNQPKILARVVDLRTASARRLGEWSHAQFNNAQASVERLIDQGQTAAAVREAEALHRNCEAAGDAAFAEAAYDGALAQKTLADALLHSGASKAAMPHADEAFARFTHLGEDRMAALAITRKADCLTDLGRYGEAGDLYQRTILLAEKRKDLRDAAVCRGQLATVCMLQKQYKEALRLYGEARDLFERLSEPSLVATSWHQVAIVYQNQGRVNAAEDAYQKSLSIKVQMGDRRAQASTLNQLGNLYASQGRIEEAIRLYLQAATIYVDVQDLLSEGLVRSNMALRLVALKRYDEARAALNRAIECDRPFGHTAEPWKTFDILSDLERAVDNQPAAQAARQQAIDTYLAYRRDGGDSEIDPTELTALVAQDPTAARAAVDDPDVPLPVAAEILLALERLQPQQPTQNK